MGNRVDAVFHGEQHVLVRAAHRAGANLQRRLYDYFAAQAAACSGLATCWRRGALKVECGVPTGRLAAGCRYPLAIEY
jgi:hypothetical protein